MYVGLTLLCLTLTLVAVFAMLKSLSLKPTSQVVFVMLMIIVCVSRSTCCVSHVDLAFLQLRCVFHADLNVFVFFRDSRVFLALTVAAGHPENL